jgi:L-glutamine:scyllo-inosose aminotransferase
MRQPLIEDFVVLRTAWKKEAAMDTLALFGGTPVRSEPFSPWPFFDDRERQHLLKALESRNWGGYPFPSALAERFGRKFAKAHGANYGIPCANGSVTMEIALQAMGLKAGEEVIVPAYTFMATASCVVRTNGVPVFVDVEPRNYCMDPAAVEAAITPDTRAIIPVHLGSSIADMDRILDIAKKHGLVVIEDCAHAHGGQWRGMGVGSMGDFGSFSLQSSKLMTSGEGGVLTVRDDVMHQKCKSIINCGRKEPGYDGFDEQLFGANYRISELQVSVALAQTERLEEVTARRATMHEYFKQTLHAQVPGLRVLETDPRVTRLHCYQTVMQYDAAAFAGVHRDRFLEALAAEGVRFSGDFYEPLYRIDIFNARSEQWPMLRKRYGEGILGHSELCCPVTEKAAWHEAVWMHYPYISGSKQDVEDVVTAIKKVQDHAAELLK